MKKSLKEFAKRFPGARATVSLLRNQYHAVRSKVAPTDGERYDRQTVKIIQRVLGGGGLAVDVGANVGDILKEICATSPNVSHHAVEPIPSLAADLRKRFPRCHVHECAVAEKPGRATFHIANIAAYSSLEARSDQYLNRIGYQNATFTDLDVRIETLDELIPTTQRVSLLKIDVESAEYRVLLGAQKLLARDKPVVIFEGGIDIADRQKAAREFFDLFTAAGMKLTTMDRWLNGKPDFQSAEDYQEAMRNDWYWFAHG
jgi:FkbM family methyltransferase